MISTEIHWVDTPWPGKLALAARPRGGDWLEDEIAAWRRNGIDTVVSLLTPDEERDLDLRKEAAATRASGMHFLAFPIPDRQTPASRNRFFERLEELDAELSANRNVVLHCRQGVGRAGLVAASLLITKGWDVETALRQLSAARGAPIPETPEQRRWIERFAGSLAALHHE